MIVNGVLDSNLIDPVTGQPISGVPNTNSGLIIAIKSYDQDDPDYYTSSIDEVNKHPDIVVTNGLTATRVGAQSASFRVDDPLPYEKIYFEAHITDALPTSTDNVVGVVDATDDLTVGYALGTSGLLSIDGTGSIRVGGSVVTTHQSGPISSESIIGIALDIPSEQFWVSVNGVYHSATADPSNGVDPISFTNPGVIHVAASIEDDLPSVEFKIGKGDFTFDVPEGFSPTLGLMRIHSGHNLGYDNIPPTNTIFTDDNVRYQHYTPIFPYTISDEGKSISFGESWFAIANEGHSSGKWYIEFLFPGGGVSGGQSFGISEYFEEVSSPNFLPLSPVKYLHQESSNTYVNFFQEAQPRGFISGVGALVGMAVDLDQNIYTTYLNGVFQNTLNASALHAGNDTMYPFLGAAGPTLSLTMNTTTNTFTYPVPAGYEPWDRE